MKLNSEQTQQLVRGFARLQARQEALECIVRAFIAEVPPMHPLAWKVLQTAQSDLSQRGDAARAYTPPECDADALALLNELRRACAPPAGDGNAR